jgi:uncharacterized damage-inducible protein DinB
MSESAAYREMLKYGDHANRLVFDAAAKLDDAKLDQPLDLGLGSLRRILLHIYNGEITWLRRWQGKVETKWPSEEPRPAPAEIFRNLEALREERDAFITGLSDEKLSASQTYRDSRGSLFTATLRQMILQGVVHSIHHRAQAANAVRRLGGQAPELDLMVSVRQPAT